MNILEGAIAPTALLGAAAGLVTALALAQPALSSRERSTAARATSAAVAGLDFNGYIGVPGAVSATLVVPRLNCAASPGTGSSLDVGVGIQSVNSYARLALACTQGAAQYSPSLVVNGVVKNVPSDTAAAGDTIQLSVSQSVSQVTVSVVDVTHPFVATSNGSGGGTGQGIVAGDFPATAGGVPDFGTLAFSSVVVNGYPLGSAGTGLQVLDLSAGSSRITTSYSAAAKEAFATVFKHS